LLGQPAGDAANDNGCDPTNFSIMHGASPQNETPLCISLALLTRAARFKVDQIDASRQPLRA
jgi:hypothetical protein